MAKPQPVIPRDETTSAPPSAAPLRIDAPRNTDAPAEAAPPRAYPLLREGMKRLDVKELIEAGRLYGDDIEREAADLEAGRHPTQRTKQA